MSPVAEAITLEADPGQVALARQLVRRACRNAGTSDDMSDAAVLLTSETVTNAIVHGGSTVLLTVCAQPFQVRVEVSDGNRSQPVIQRPDPAAISGRGLSIVSATASCWGVLDLQVGKTVWFELLPAPPGSPLNANGQPDS